MLLLRLSGHSCAGKTRLVNALPQFGIKCPKVIRYTSRPPRPEEIEGGDYYFRSREIIAALPEEKYLVGQVRNMLQAFDLDQIASDLGSNDLLLIEIHPDLWPKLTARLSDRLGNRLKTASVFLTAVDPESIRKFRNREEKAGFITSQVFKMLINRNKDEIKDIKIRAFSASNEILKALSPAGSKMYQKIIHSSPEGPEGMDNWTREGKPVGKALEALMEFRALITQISPTI